MGTKSLIPIDQKPFLSAIINIISLHTESLLECNPQHTTVQWDSFQPYLTFKWSPDGLKVPTITSYASWKQQWRGFLSGDGNCAALLNLPFIKSSLFHVLTYHITFILSSPHLIVVGKPCLESFPGGWPMNKALLVKLINVARPSWYWQWEHIEGPSVSRLIKVILQ